MATNGKLAFPLFSLNRQILTKCSVPYACLRTYSGAPAWPYPKPRLPSRRIWSDIRTVNQVHEQFSSPRLAFKVISRQLSCAPTLQTMYRTEERGVPNTDSYRVFIRNESGPVSPFHDIPLYANAEEKIFNMVVEVPRWTNAKMEISKEEALNPIKQDIKKGKLRFVANCFPHHGYIWNYGALPQTWENPHVLDSHTECKGDNDPIDVCEIGHRVAKRGDVVQVKVLGTIALIDEGETDWKVIAIDVKDPLAASLNDIEDVEKHMPGFLAATLEWFKVYKIPDGKPPNNFAFNGEAKNREFALKVIEETHACWKSLMANQVDAAGIDRCCVAVDDCSYKVAVSEAEEHVKKHGECIGECEALSSEVDKWHYVKLHQ